MFRSWNGPISRAAGGKSHFYHFIIEKKEQRRLCAMLEKCLSSIDEMLVRAIACGVYVYAVRFDCGLHTMFLITMFAFRITLIYFAYIKWTVWNISSMYLSLHVEINNAQTRFHFGFYFEHSSSPALWTLFTHIQSTMHAFGEFALSAQCFCHKMEYGFQPSVLVQITWIVCKKNMLNISKWNALFAKNMEFSKRHSTQGYTMCRVYSVDWPKQFS